MAEQVSFWVRIRRFIYQKWQSLIRPVLVCDDNKCVGIYGVAERDEDGAYILTFLEGTIIFPRYCPMCGRRVKNGH